MSRLHAIHAFVPLVTLSVSLTFIVYGFVNQTVYLVLIGFVFVYLFPLGLNFIQSKVYPIRIGVSSIQKRKFHPWLVSYRTQLIFIQFPVLERILMLIPGLYNVWLRAWGSKIGKRVFIAPTVKIRDRGLLEIGDDVIIGDECIVISHLISKKQDGMRVFAKKTVFKGNHLIGAYSILPAGFVLSQNKNLPPLSVGTINSTDKYYSSYEDNNLAKKGPLSQSNAHQTDL